MNTPTSSAPLMPNILRGLGALRIFMALLGMSFLVKNLTEASAPSLPPAYYAIQILLVGTAVCGGVGWLLLKDWGRKFLLIPTLFALSQTLTLLLMGYLPSGVELLPIAGGLLVSAVTLVFIFLPAARCENPSWGETANEAVFRGVGAFQAVVVLAMIAMLLLISQGMEGLAVAVFTAPTVSLAFLAAIAMLRGKNWGRKLLIVLWGFHLVLAGIGPALARFSAVFEIWQVFLTGAVTLAFRAQSATIPVANLVFLVVGVLLAAAWLPSALRARA